MALRYTLSSYFALLEMTHEKHILLEGQDDKLLIAELIMKCKHMPQDQTTWGIAIDSADEIENDAGMDYKGNREFVEVIHCHVKETATSNKLLCFVDREYRQFLFEPNIQDTLSSHYSYNGITWSIGHSIENYLFTADILCDGLNAVCTCHSKHTAQMLFRNVFVDAVRKIAATSIAAHFYGLSGLPMGTLKWEYMRPHDTILEISVNDWKSAMGCHGDKMVAEFNKWLIQMPNLDTLVCQRLCRGHTGVVLFQKVFAACLYCAHCSISESEARTQAIHLATLPENLVRCALSVPWAKQAAEGISEYPKEFIDLI